MSDEKHPIFSVDAFIKPTDIRRDIRQQVIVTTKDKLTLSLNNHDKERDRQQEWKASISVFCGILGTFLTADFKDFILDKSVWQALYLLIGGVSLFFVIRSAISTFGRWRKPPESMITELMKNSEVLAQDENISGLKK